MGWMMKRRCTGLACLAVLLLVACDKGDEGVAEECLPVQTAMTEALALADEAMEAFRPAIQAGAETPPAIGEAACPRVPARLARGGGLDGLDFPTMNGSRCQAEPCAGH